MPPCPNNNHARPAARCLAAPFFHCRLQVCHGPAPTEQKQNRTKWRCLSIQSVSQPYLLFSTTIACFCFGLRGAHAIGFFAGLGSLCVSPSVPEGTVEFSIPILRRFETASLMVRPNPVHGGVWTVDDSSFDLAMYSRPDDKVASALPASQSVINDIPVLSRVPMALSSPEHIPRLLPTTRQDRAVRFNLTTLSRLP